MFHNSNLFMFIKTFYCFYYSFISSKFVLKYMKNKIRRPQKMKILYWLATQQFIQMHSLGISKT
jgi:hypothetical protein